MFETFVNIVSFNLKAGFFDQKQCSRNILLLICGIIFIMKPQSYKRAEILGLNPKMLAGTQT